MTAALEALLGLHTQKLRNHVVGTTKNPLLFLLAQMP